MIISMVEKQIFINQMYKNQVKRNNIGELIKG